MGPRLTTAALVVGVGASLAVPAVAAGTQPTEIGLGDGRPAPAGVELEGARVATAGTQVERAATLRATASASSASAVKIRDFSFNPGGVTVHTGDTVTWTNDGKVSTGHTVSGKGFDSGVLHSGASYSHAFSSPGTFSYVCKIHPFMKGKVTVLAASTSSNTPLSGDGSSGASGSSAPTTTQSSPASPTGSSTASNSSGSLPMTGSELWLLALTGLELAACGLVLRRLAR